MKTLKSNNVIFLSLLSLFIFSFMLLPKQQPLTNQELKSYTERCIKYEGNPTYVLKESSSDVMQVICWSNSL